MSSSSGHHVSFPRLWMSNVLESLHSLFSMYVLVWLVRRRRSFIMDLHHDNDSNRIFLDKMLEHQLNLPQTIATDPHVSRTGELIVAIVVSLSIISTILFCQESFSLVLFNHYSAEYYRKSHCRYCDMSCSTTTASDELHSHVIGHCWSFGHYDCDDTRLHLRDQTKMDLWESLL